MFCKSCSLIKKMKKKKKDCKLPSAPMMNCIVNFFLIIIKVNINNKIGKLDLAGNIHKRLFLSLVLVFEQGDAVEKPLSKDKESQ